MRKSMLRALFDECVTARYQTTEADTDWSAEAQRGELRIRFAPSHGTRDWLHNLTFHAVPYEEMTPTWQCHSGFLTCWKSVLPHLSPFILHPNTQRVVIIGYSHGAALALLCHEYVWFHRPDLRERLLGVGFGCPRVLYGCVPPEIAPRWERFFVVRNIDDIVTHLPPRVLGYCHVGNLIEVGKEGRYSSVDAHRPESYRREL